MTTELLVMNKSAVALAADSAIMVSRKGKRKIYNTANKLFSLSTRCPVGIMIYGNAEINGVPWETIIKIYKNNFFKNKRETIKDYTSDFISFLSDTNNFMCKSLFPKEQQEISFGTLVYLVFSQILKNIDDEINDLTSKKATVNIDKIIEKMIKVYFNEYSVCPDLNGISEEFGTEILTKYSNIVLKCKAEIFGKYSISEESNEQLMKICAYIACKDRFIDPSGIVIAGFGEKDVFPAFESLIIDAVLNNKVKYKVSDSICISHTKKACIMPFAQRDIVETFMLGIDPRYDEVIRGYMKSILTCEYPEKIINELDGIDINKKIAIKEKLINAGEKSYQDYLETCQKHCTDYHYDPVYQAIESMPKDELAMVADSLVSIASARKRMSLEEETVGGPCDVAIISKGDGFIWIKRKHYFEKDLNPQYVARYFKNERREKIA